MNLFEANPQENLLPFDGEVNYFGTILNNKQANDMYKNLFTSINWKPDEILINGKYIQTKRKVAWHGDNKKVYHYSGSTKFAEPWNDCLNQLKKIIETHCQIKFNSCLLNYYENGEHAMAWHSDDETELGHTPVIASLSLGSTRKFSFKHKTKKHQCSIELENGSLMIMKGDTQNHWLHSLPVDSKCRDGRINLTFRIID